MQSTAGRDTPLSLQAISELVAAEEAEQSEVLHLAANETVLSARARGMLASPLAGRHLLEHLEMRQSSPARLGNLLLRGLDRINAIEQSAAEVCFRLFGSTHAEFRCLSGLHALQTALAALSEPGDAVMRVATKDGGNPFTELMCRALGRESLTYVFRDDQSLDTDRTREVLERARPSLLLVDPTNRLFPFPLAELKEIAGDVPVVFDASHALGLIAGGRFQDPLREGAALMLANTHVTFFGPQKGLVLGNDRNLMEKLGYTLSSATVSSQHTASTIALFVALHEMWHDGHAYAARVVDNAGLLAGRLRERGVPVLAEERGFTANHMFFADTRSAGTGPVVLERLLRANVSANRVVAFNRDTIRFGVQEVTRRGYGDAELTEAADLLAPLLLGTEEPERIRPGVVELVRQHDEVHFTGEASASVGRAAPKRYGSPRAAATRPFPPGRPRWIAWRLAPAAALPQGDAFERVRELGALAGAFPHQIDSAGNISFTDPRGRHFVTASGAYIKDLAPEHFMEVTGRDGWTLQCRGDRPPSAEVYLHHLLRERTGAAYIVHNHCILGRDPEDEKDVLVLPPQEYGSVALAEAVAGAAADGRVLYVRRHGLVFWAAEYEECRGLVERLARRAGPFPPA